MKQLYKGYKWEVLGLLWVAFLLNQADRQVFNVVLPLIKADLNLTDVEIGTIATVFNLVYAALVPLAGYAGDIFSRKWIVTLSIIFWSVATMFTGLGNSMLMLIIMRSVATGGGEAFFGPANYSLLAQYHKKTRSLAMSLHQTSYYIGIILSGYVAGYLGEHYGWRFAFYAFGGIGVIHGIILAFRLKDKKKDTVQIENGERVKFWEGVKIIFRTPTALILTIGFSGLIFVLVGYLTWTPTYLYENFGMTLSNAGFHSMFYTHLFAFIGILFAGKYSDFLAKKKPQARMLVQALGLLVAAPFILLMGNSNTLWLVYIGFAGFGFGRAFFDANTYAVLYDVIPEKYHSSASGIMLMIGFSVGSLSPIILGYLKPIIGLSMGISLLAIVWVLCGVLFLVGYKFYFLKDYNKNQSANLKR
ncbi:MFS transporter [Zobellia alginiliquefaciens]|uniref:MFS transporter n=1 Tax=Zobellia alginiliquefaciens TaxID=3032586 RepID=UPI0023E37C07|nr:MFS transporter [Zobellia alginiliquefaciens]